MIRDIITHVNDNFTEIASVPLVADDVRAYRFVFKTPYDLTECTFVVTATRADYAVVADNGTTSGNEAYYIIKNNMYSVAGETKFRLTIQSADGSAMTAKEVICEVLEGNGSADITGDDRVPILTNLIGSVAGLQSKFGGFITAENMIDGQSIENGSIDTNKLSADFVGENGIISDNRLGGKLKKVLPNTDFYLAGEDENIDIELFPGTLYEVGDYVVHNVVIIADKMFPVTYTDTINFSVYEAYDGTHQKVTFASMPTKQYHRSVMLFTGDVPNWTPFTCIDIDPADNLETEDISRPLSANMGKVLSQTKVDKIEGKGLSSNDFTISEKNKLAGLSNYNDTKIKADIEKKSDKPTIIETVVNAPAWANQPTVDLANNCFILTGLDTGSGVLAENAEVDFTSDGTLPTGFADYRTNYYYIHIVDADTGKFQLMETSSTPASVVTLSDVGTGWKMRFNTVASVEISLPEHMQNKDFNIAYSGLVGIKTYYTYLRFNGELSTSNYRTISSVGAYNGDSGILLSFGSSISRKFIHVSASMKIIRNKNCIIVDYSRLSSGGDSYDSMATQSHITSSGMLFAKNPYTHSVEGVAIPSIRISFGGTPSTLKNGFTIKLMEVA